MLEPFLCLAPEFIFNQKVQSMILSPVSLKNGALPCIERHCLVHCVPDPALLHLYHIRPWMIYCNDEQSGIKFLNIK